MLLVEGREEDADVIAAEHSICVEMASADETERLVGRGINLAETTLSPRSSFLDRTLADIDFRAVYGLSVLAIWRRGDLIEIDIAEVPLELGDVLLVYGPIRHIRKLEKSREEDPSNRDATYWLSAAYIATGQTDLAREFTREARSQFADDTDIAILYALVLYHDRDLSGAERELRRVLNIHPDNAVAALNLGLVLMEADRVAEARSVLEQVINAYPGEPLGLRARSILDKKSGD